jgi:hypothetical protein
MMAADSLARSTLTPSEYALAIGGLDVPADVPGVVDGVDGAVMAG